MDHCGISGQKWLDQFACGFPITGVLSQKYTSELTHPGHDLLTRSDLYRSASRRFRDRAARSVYKNRAKFWDEAMTQHTQCWLEALIPLNSDGRPTTWRPKRFNIACRIGVEQAEKLLAFDDLRQSLTNLALHVTTPIQLDPWGRISQLSQLLNDGSDDWGSLKRTTKPLTNSSPGPLRPGRSCHCAS